MKEKLQQYMQQNEMTQTQVAKAIGKSTAVINQYLKGTYKGKADHDDGPDALEMLWKNAVSSSAPIEWIGLNETEFGDHDFDDDLYSIWRG